MDSIRRFVERHRRYLLLALFVLVLSSVMIYFVAQYWDWLRMSQSGNVSATETGSATVRNIGLVVVAMIALPLAIWRSNTAHRQALSAQIQSETAQDSLLNERYQTGTEMLGSPSLSVRLGGIYSLDRLAKEHADSYHIQIMQLFASYIQNPPSLETN